MPLPNVLPVINLVNFGADVELKSYLSDLLAIKIKQDEDWDRFFFLFEQLYPSFLLEIYQLNPDLSKAELGLACLLILHLPNQRIASILNIRLVSVRKANERLRKKLGFLQQSELLDYLSRIRDLYKIT